MDATPLARLREWEHSHARQRAYAPAAETAAAEAETPPKPAVKERATVAAPATVTQPALVRSGERSGTRAASAVEAVVIAESEAIAAAIRPGERAGTRAADAAEAALFAAVEATGAPSALFPRRESVAEIGAATAASATECEAAKAGRPCSFDGQCVRGWEHGGRPGLCILRPKRMRIDASTDADAVCVRLAGCFPTCGTETSLLAGLGQVDDSLPEPPTECPRGCGKVFRDADALPGHLRKCHGRRGKHTWRRWREMDRSAEGGGEEAGEMGSSREDGGNGEDGVGESGGVEIGGGSAVGHCSEVSISGTRVALGSDAGGTDGHSSTASCDGTSETPGGRAGAPRSWDDVADLSNSLFDMLAGIDEGDESYTPTPEHSPPMPTAAWEPPQVPLLLDLSAPTVAIATAAETIAKVTAAMGAAPMAARTVMAIPAPIALAMPTYGCSAQLVRQVAELPYSEVCRNSELVSRLISTLPFAYALPLPQDSPPALPLAVKTFRLPLDLPPSPSSPSPSPPSPPPQQHPQPLEDDDNGKWNWLPALPRQPKASHANEQACTSAASSEPSASVFVSSTAALVEKADASGMATERSAIGRGRGRGRGRPRGRPPGRGRGRSGRSSGPDAKVELALEGEQSAESGKAPTLSTATQRVAQHGNSSRRKRPLVVEVAEEEEEEEEEEEVEQQQEEEGGMLTAYAKNWALSVALAREEDMSVEAAFLSCLARSRKGGWKGLSPVEKLCVESFKVLLWGYVATCSRLSMRALKMDAAFDEAAKVELATDDATGQNVNLSDGLVLDGYSFLIEHLAASQEGMSEMDVVFDASVRTIEHDPDGVTLRLADGTSCRADMVIVAVPLGVLKRDAGEGGIDFSPPLCDAKRAAIDDLGMGTENKVALRWAASDIFWPADVPYLQLSDPRFRILNAHCFGKAGVLVVLIAPPFAEEMEALEDEELVQIVLTLLRTTFAPSCPELPPLLEQQITRWGQDPCSYGAYSYDKLGCKPGQRSELRAAETPPGGEMPRLFFAGEACSTDAPQCVHGAVDTGREAAAELLRSIGLSTCELPPEVAGGLSKGPLVCKCRAVFDPRREMVTCKTCGGRFHNECVGIPPAAPAADDADGRKRAPAQSFRCPACAPPRRPPE